VLSQSIAQIRLTNARPSMKYNMLLYRYNKFLLVEYAARSKMAVFDLLKSTPLFSFTVIMIFTAAGAVVNLDSITLMGLDEAAQGALREKV
jgi:hypothetical protein